MTATAAQYRPDFAPPPPPGRGPSVLLAVAAHAVLLLALTFGVQWRSQTETPAIVAELWSAVPAQAAPQLQAPPPEAPPEPPKPRPVAEPMPAPKVAPAPPPPLPSEAAIALQREKQKKAAQEQRQQELLAQQKAERDKAAREAKAELDKRRKLEELKAEDKRLAELRDKQKKQREKEHEKEREKEREEALAKEADAKAKAAKAKAQAAQDAKNLEAQRAEQLKRMTGLAGATGSEQSTGTALKSSGPSASYAGLVSGRVKPNIVFPDEIAGNPMAEVEVRTAPDGTITSRRITKSSGNRAWDEAVLKALDKTETLPRDQGKPPPSPMVIGFRPKD